LVSAVITDLICGGVGTTAIFAELINGGFDFRRELWLNTALLKGIALLAIYETVLTVWEVARHKLRGDAASQVKVALGMRGLGLFLMCFLVAAINHNLHDNGATARLAMLLINCAVLALAAFNSIGLFWVQAETNWLHEYLRTRPKEKS
jgi:hypothetical protein